MLLVGMLCTPISACEGTADIVIHPEFDLSYSFESGLEQWSGDGVDLFDPIVTWSAERTGQQASLGGSSVQLSLDNANGVAKIWIERGFTVDPSRSYNVDISFDIGTADSGQADSWRLLAGAHTSPPDIASELTVQDATGNGAVSGTGLVWLSKSYRVSASSGADGRMTVVIGLWGTSEGARSYYIDNVRLLFTRAF